MTASPSGAKADTTRLSRRWTRYGNGCAVAGLMAAAVLIYGRYLGKDHFTASGDFPPAVSYALNYRLAVADGQWLPRLVVIPRDVSLGLGSIDGTVPTADAPDFQYYAFLQSALAYPFLLIGVPGIKSVQYVVVLAFAFAAIVLYATGRIIGARPAVAFLAGFSYIISPWLVSNFYGRGGVSEALGQASLPLLLLGFAYACRARFFPATLAVAAGVAALTLSHNIFLLYGVVLAGVLAGVLLFFPPAPGDGASGWMHRWRAPVALGVGAGLGLALTAWQWLPAALTLREISFQYFGAFGEVGRIPKAYADWSGALGLPRQFVEPWSGTPREFFFTIGWWTVPGILLLVFCRTENRAAALAVSLSFLAFVLLMVFPQQIYPHLPGPFGATQFTFRLLAYLSVLGSFALVLALPNLNSWVVLATLVLVTWSQLRVINFPMPFGGGTTPLHEEQYLKGSEYNAFYANSPAEYKLRYYPDGMLQPDNILNLYQRFWNRAGTRLVEKIAQHVPVFIRIKGRVVDGLPQTKLHLARVADPLRLASDQMEVTGSSFDITLTVPDAHDNLRLSAEPTLPKGKRTLSIQPREFFVMWGDPRSLVPAGELRLTSKHGYARTFAAGPATQTGHVPDPAGDYTVEIPMIYSRFLVAQQNGRPLDTAVDFNHRLNVRTKDLASEITVAYRLPALVWWLTGFGTLGGLVCAVGAARTNRRLVQDGRRSASG